MANPNTGWAKVFLGLGILAIVSGIYFILKNEYVEGITAAMVGILLVFLNLKNTKGKNHHHDV